MKSFLIIGLGRFGTHLCKDLSKLDNEIMVVDENEAVMEDVLSFVTSAKIGDCTNEKVLATLGVGNFDVCFVCIGSNFQSSLEITSLLKEMGARYVVSKANRDIHAKCSLSAVFLRDRLRSLPWHRPCPKSANQTGSTFQRSRRGALLFFRQ